MASQDDYDPSQVEPVSRTNMRRLTPRQQATAVSLSRLQLLQAQRNRTADLSERRFDTGASQFQQKEAREASQFSQTHDLEKMRVASELINKLSETVQEHAAFEMQIQRQESVMSAVSQLAKLRPDFNPKVHGSEYEALNDYNKRFTQFQADHADVLDHPWVKPLIEQREKEYQNLHQALENKAISQFRGPSLAAYQQTLAATNDPAMAVARATGIMDNMNKVNDFMKAGHVKPQDVNAATDPQTGVVDYNKLLDTGAANQGAQAREEADRKAQDAQLGTLTRTAQSLGKNPSGVSDDKTQAGANYKKAQELTGDVLGKMDQRITGSATAGTPINPVVAGAAQTVNSPVNPPLVSGATGATGQSVDLPGGVSIGKQSAALQVGGVTIGSANGTAGAAAMPTPAATTINVPTQGGQQRKALADIFGAPPPLPTPDQSQPAIP